MGTFITVDIGGTHMRAAVYPHNSTQHITHQKINTREKKRPVFDRLITLIQSVWPPDQDVLGISVATPGPLDPKTGIIIATPNIPEWSNFAIGPRLAAQFKVPVYVGNDANLAALGEWHFGAGQGHNDLLYLTISTGIGGGVINQGQLLHGYRGLGAELGHTTIMLNGPVCSCGQKGHLEALASGPAIARYVKQKINEGAPTLLDPNIELTARNIADAAQAGDALAAQAIELAGRYIGIGLATFLHIFEPSIVIFGGGVSQIGDLLFNPIKTTLQEHVMSAKYLEHLTITTAALGDDAGLLGALALAKLSYQ